MPEEYLSKREASYFVRETTDRYGRQQACHVLFPDGTIIKEASLGYCGGTSPLLVIMIHGWEAQSFANLEVLKFKFLVKKED